MANISSLGRRRFHDDRCIKMPFAIKMQVQCAQLSAAALTMWLCALRLHGPEALLFAVGLFLLFDAPRASSRLPCWS